MGRLAITPVRSSVALALVLALPAVAHAGTEGAVSRAAGALAASQRDFPEAAGQATWPWQQDAARPAPNAAGLVALGLVRAWERTGSETARAAADAWARARLDDLAAWRPVYDPDIEALAALGRATGEAAYTEAAHKAFARRWGGATGAEALARIRIVRAKHPRLVGYDAALALRAASAAGEADFATDLARALLKDRAAWDLADDPTGLGTTSRAAVLGALSTLDRKAFAAPIAELALRLVKAQGEDGSWASRNTQATAYAVAALGALPDGRAQTAAARGAKWLVATQLDDGAWATFNDGLPPPFVGEVVHEVTAEALLALAGVG